VPDFAELWPERFSNKTNGVTPRRWLLACNPGLAAAISKRIGNHWIRDLEQLRRLEGYADDPDFQEEFRAVKRANKQRLAERALRHLGISVSPDALFDVHVKRLHEYKRQLLNILQVVMRYQRLRYDPETDAVPRVVLFGAKAAPAYWRAKLIIKLINNVAHTINLDKGIGDRLRVAFLPNYGVSLAEEVMPAADLSEQISTAGMEASGTGNMKFAMNGALTIGTLDGANIEIREAVGQENFFLFGLTAEEVAQRRPEYDPWQIYHENPAVRRALDAIAGGEFSPEAPELFRPIRDWLTHERDYYMLLADIESYVEAQQRVDALWRKPQKWTRAAILNVARIGHFSSDRAVREYAEDIWRVRPISIGMPSEAGWKRRATETRAPKATTIAKVPPPKSARTATRKKTANSRTKTRR
jgi:starch phosphorylase